MSPKQNKKSESEKHIEEVIKDVTIYTVDLSSRRKASLKGVETVPELDRDEYPPAIFFEGGTGLLQQLYFKGVNAVKDKVVSVVSLVKGKVGNKFDGAKTVKSIDKLR